MLSSIFCYVIILAIKNNLYVLDKEGDFYNTIRFVTHIFGAESTLDMNKRRVKSEK